MGSNFTALCSALRGPVQSRANATADRAGETLGSKLDRNWVQSRCFPKRDGWRLEGHGLFSYHMQKGITRNMLSDKEKSEIRKGNEDTAVADTALSILFPYE